MGLCLVPLAVGLLCFDFARQFVGQIELKTIEDGLTAT